MPNILFLIPVGSQDTTVIQWMSISRATRRQNKYLVGPVSNLFAASWLIDLQKIN